MDCIICQDTGSEPVQDNISCKCKYKLHSSCWIDYVHSRKKVICPLCRTDLSIKTNQPSTAKTPFIQSVPVQMPYTPSLHTIQEETGHQISYQEFVNNVHNNIRVENTYINRQPSNQSKKITKFIIICGIIIAVIILICILG